MMTAFVRHFRLDLTRRSRDVQHKGPITDLREGIVPLDNRP